MKRFTLSMGYVAGPGGYHVLRVSRLRSRGVAAIATTAGVAAVGAGLYSKWQNQDSYGRTRVAIPTAIVDAVAGAVGEVAQVLVLYPLDTIKVRCQALGMTAAEVVKDLLAQGVNIKLLKNLYAGALGAALCSLVVGGVHFASYETSRRWVLKQTGSHDTHSTAASSCSQNGDNTASHDKLSANIFAAVFAAVITAMIESPVELFRHNQQAGLVKGNFMREMLSTVRTEGPGGLYWGFLPHCFEAWPHDVSELLVYGHMTDFHLDSQHPDHEHHSWMRKVPVEAWDLATGAAAGGAAVLISMPFDCIKTYMQTHGTDLTGKGILGSARLFLRTGSRMVARKGMGALYYGVVPRLLQQVPSSMLNWYVIHAVQRMLLPYTESSRATAG